MNYVKEIRTIKGWTQTEMADRLGVSFRSIQDLEAKGYTPKTPAAFERLAGLGRQVGIEVQEVRPPKRDKPVPVRDVIEVKSPSKPPHKGPSPNIARTRRAGLVAPLEYQLMNLLSRIAEEYAAEGVLTSTTLHEIAHFLGDWAPAGLTNAKPKATKENQ